MNKTHDELCQENQMLRDGIRQMVTITNRYERVEQFSSDHDLWELESSISRRLDEMRVINEMAQDRAAMVGLIAEALGVSEEPHQGRDMRILEAAQQRTEYLQTTIQRMRREWAAQADPDYLRERAAEAWKDAADEVMKLAFPVAAKTFRLTAARHLKFKAEKLRQGADEIAAADGNCPDGLSCDYSKKNGNCGDPLCQPAGSEA
ncbi:hypothetical protein R5R73_01190 [Salinicola sp. LHM]|uniref:hypothetical protein n=1 Tax=Salinicola sp. LHM TaxID=3065298 RepID=UPI002ACEB56F|nr:hypothetical protein [Salinicola sp. LHM]WQH33341.1 hypothetical protein R5R73_01190 [Salinicola sp. LHM]